MALRSHPAQKRDSWQCEERDGSAMASSSSRGAAKDECVGEDLMELELGVVGGGLADGSAAEASGAKREAGSSTGAPSSTPGKRRKTASAASSSVSAQSKSEVDYDPSGALAELGSIGGDDDGGDKLCAGCSRSSKTGKCFLNPEEPVPWSLPSSRGAWCRDCFNTWRLWFSGQHKQLVNMPAYFRQNASIKTEFEVVLVSYLSLRRGGYSWGAPKHMPRKGLHHRRLSVAS